MSHHALMEQQLREALTEYRESLRLISSLPETEETLRTRTEIEDAIERTIEVLDEFEGGATDEEQSTDGLMEVVEVDNASKDSSKKRKHDSVARIPGPVESAAKEFFDRPLDFGELGRKYSDFGKHLHLSRDGSSTMDFTDAQATLDLTKVLLKEYYDIEWDVPLGQLVPPVPCRAKYITWINDLLRLTDPSLYSSQPTASNPTSRVKGLDIGCGANCIYPLLGASLFGWQFIGTDVTEIAIHYARSNVYRNARIRDLIEITKISKDCKEIITPTVDQHGTFHFSMCNPPFFASEQEAGRNQRTAFGGTHDEMVYPGGEVAFVHKMIQESIELKGKIGWYSTMLGKKSSLKTVPRIFI